MNLDSAEHAQPGYSRRVRQAEAEQAIFDLAEQQAHEDAGLVLAAIRAMSSYSSPKAYALICTALASHLNDGGMGTQDCTQAAIEFLDDAATVITEAA